MISVVICGQYHLPGSPAPHTYSHPPPSPFDVWTIGDPHLLATKQDLDARTVIQCTAHASVNTSLMHLLDNGDNYLVSEVTWLALSTFYSRVFKDDCAAVWLSPSHTHSHTPSKRTTVCSSSLSESEQKLCSNPGSERLGSGFRWWKQKDNDHALFGHVIILCPKTHHCNGQCRLTTVMVSADLPL